MHWQRVGEGGREGGGRGGEGDGEQLRVRVSRRRKAQRKEGVFRIVIGAVEVFFGLNCSRCGPALEKREEMGNGGESGGLEEYLSDYVLPHDHVVKPYYLVSGLRPENGIFACVCGCVCIGLVAVVIKGISGVWWGLGARFWVWGVRR